MDFHTALLMAITLLGFSVGAMTGFGSSVIPLTFGVHLYSLDFLIPVIIPLNILFCGYLAVRHWTGIDRPVLMRTILPYALIGMPIGLIVFTTVNTEKLKIAFGAFVLCLSIFELVRLIRADRQAALRPLSPIRSRLWLLLGGIVQGLWASGGPLFAYWAGRNISGKREFRSTLSALWLLLNLILLASHAAMNKFTLETLRMSAMLLPFVAAGVVIGERLHDRLPEKNFRIAVFSVLIFAGASIVIRGL